MAHFAFVGQRENVGIDLVAGEGLDRERRHELRRGVGQDGAHRRAALAQAADQVERFIGGDAAGNDQQHPPIGKRHGRSN